MEEYLRRAFLREDEALVKCASVFELVTIKTAQPSAPMAAGNNMEALPPTNAASANPDGMEDPATKKSMLERTLANLQKSPVIALFSKDPAPVMTPEGQAAQLPPAQPQEKMASVGLGAAIKALAKAKRSLKPITGVVKPTTTVKGISKSLPTKAPTARQIMSGKAVAGYTPPKLPKAAIKPPRVVKVTAPKPPTAKTLNRKVPLAKALKVLKDKGI